MIVINPIVTIGKDVVTAFCDQLNTSLKAKGEGIYLITPSAAVDTKKLIASLNPDVIFNIKCSSDLDTSIKGFSIDCDQYTALVGTLAFAFVQSGMTPAYITGYHVTGSTSAAKLCEMTISLGYVSNVQDMAALSDITKIIDNIVSFCYAPPTTTVNYDYDVVTPDPYFTKGLWSEVASSKTMGDSGVVESAVVSNVPLKVLHLSRSTVGSNPYYWKTDITYEKPGESHKCILSIRNISLDLNTDAEVRVALGDMTPEVASLTDRDWAQLSFIVDDVPATSTLKVGILNASQVLITSVWVAPAGVFDSLDDPENRYSIFPPQYRPDITLSLPSDSPDIIRQVATKASSLKARASDTSLPNLGSLAEGLASQLNTLNLNPQAFLTTLTPVVSNLLGQALTKAPVLDPSKIKVNYKMMEQMLPDVNKLSKQMSLQQVTNSMKNIERAVTHQLSSMNLADLEKEEAEYAEIVKQRIKKIGKGMEV